MGDSFTGSGDGTGPATPDPPVAGQRGLFAAELDDVDVSAAGTPIATFDALARCVLADGTPCSV